MIGTLAGSVTANESVLEVSQEVKTNDINTLNGNRIKNLLSNHRTDSEDAEKEEFKGLPPSNIRHSRQYDAPISSSSSGNYAAVSGDSGAYVAQVPLTGTNYGPGSSSGGSYANDLANAYHPNIYHDPISLARGYSAGVGPMHHNAAAYPPPYGGSSIFSAGGAGSGLLSSSMFPLMSKGLDLSEIVCTAVAVAIGAVVIGAPFILIYLFVMNQMNGNGPSMGPSGGSISLTGPTSSTNVSGRKKRQISWPEALFKQLNPLVDHEQVANTFKALMNSIAKYQM